MKIQNFLISILMSVLIFSPAFAVTTPNSYHFQAVPHGTVVCTATTSSSHIGLAAGAPANAPDAIIRNLGSQVVYYEIGTGTPVAVVAINGPGGSQSINPGEADLVSKFASDQFACITSTGTADITITPGTGN